MNSPDLFLRLPKHARAVRLLFPCSPTRASAAHHGRGAPSGRRMPTEARVDESHPSQWSRKAAFVPEGARGEPRMRGEGTQSPGAGCGAEPRVIDGVGNLEAFVARLSFLDTNDTTRQPRETCVQRAAP